MNAPKHTGLMVLLLTVCIAVVAAGCRTTAPALRPRAKTNGSAKSSKSAPAAVNVKSRWELKKQAEDKDKVSESNSVSATASASNRPTESSESFAKAVKPPTTATKSEQDAAAVPHVDQDKRADSSEKLDKSIVLAEKERVALRERQSPKSEDKTEKKTEKKRSFWSRLAFWRKSEAEGDKKLPGKPEKKVLPVQKVTKISEPAGKEPDSVSKHPAETTAPEEKKVALKPVQPAVSPKPTAVSVAKEPKKQAKEGRKGFFSSLAFWRGSEEAKPGSAPTVTVAAKQEKAALDNEKTIPEVPASNALITAATNYVENFAVIKSGFVIKVLVMASGRKEVDEQEKRISADGYLTLPLVGSIKVEDMTIRELSDHLTQLYSKYLRQPMVDVDFVLDPNVRGASPWGYVTVLGRVKQPGRVSVPPTKDMTLSTAIQQAGGFDSSAKMTGIKITRIVDGKPDQFEIDLQSIGDKGKVRSDILLAPGDFVYVPERVF